MNNGVYKITNTSTGDCYVGSCARAVGGFKSRWKDHIRSLQKNKHHSIILQNAWNKCGESNFRFEILEVCEPARCIIREQHYIDTLLPKYNILKFAGSSLGSKRTPEQKQALKNRSYDWMRGDNNWNKDPARKEFQREKLKKLNISQYITEETKHKISEATKGRPKSESHKEKISVALVGYNKTDEHLQKISDGMRLWATTHENPMLGKTHSAEIRRKISDAVRGKTKGLMVAEKNPMFGKTHSDEKCKIMSDASKKFWASERGITRKKELAEKMTGNPNVYAAPCGSDHPRYNKTQHTFYHEETNDTFVGTTGEFVKKYKLTGGAYYLANGKYKTHKGWTLL